MSMADMYEQMRRGCARCGAKTNAMIMSMYSEAMICMDCKDKEKKRPDYDQAVKKDLNEYAGRLDAQGMSAHADSVRKNAASIGADA